MTNSSLPAYSSSTPNAQIQGITEIRQKTIAALIARGFSVKYVAKKLKISESRIYHLVSDKNSLVNAEINRILNEAFAASDRRLINLYNKALQKLDAMLSSPDEEKQCRAIDRIIKMFFARSSKNAVTIQQYFGEAEKESIDDFILQRRKERGLTEHEHEEEEKEVTSSP
jgi:transcriptional regulator with XRE-family HTH domain